MKYLPLLLIFFSCSQVEYIETVIVETETTTDTVEVCDIDYPSYCHMVDFTIDAKNGWVCLDAEPDSLEQYMYFYWRLYSLWTGEIIYLYEWNPCTFIRFRADNEGWRANLQVSMDGDPIGEVDCGRGIIKAFTPY